MDEHIEHQKLDSYLWNSWGPLLSTTLSTTLQDVFILCALNDAVKLMPEMPKYNEELLVYWKQGKCTMYDCPGVHAKYGKWNEIKNGRWLGSGYC